MELNLYDCRNCRTRGVMIMADGACPNCKRPLDEQDRQQPKAPNAAASDWENLPDEYQLRRRRQRRKQGTILAACGTVLLLSSPAIFFALMPFGDKSGRPGAFDQGNVACLWAARLLFVGWISTEIGLIRAGYSRRLQILARVYMYAYILLGLLVLLFVWGISGVL